MRYVQSNVRIRNAATIADGVEIDATGVELTNTESGRIIGGVRFLQGGNVLINEIGGIVRVANGVDPFSTPAIVGSTGADTVVNAGLISGLVQLGDGNDRYIKSGSTSNSYEQVDLGTGDDVFENADNATSVFANGGIGRDQVILSLNNQQVIDGSALTGFEDLRLSGNGQFFRFSGYSSITFGTPQEYGLALIESTNPAVDVTLAGNRLRLSASSLRNVAGSAADEGLELTGSSAIAGRVDMGGGNDRLTLSRFSAGDALPQLPDGGATGGAGYDTLELTSYAPGTLAVDLATVTGFEALSLNYNYILQANYDIRNASNFRAIDLGSQSSLTLRASTSLSANISGGFGGTIMLDSQTKIGSYGFPLDQGFDQSTNIVQGDDRLSVTFINQGRISGEMRFYIGDDIYDGSAGSVGSTVYGNAGNDILIGGSANEVFDGGFGADRLSGNGGADMLRGGGGNDTLDGGNGLDTMAGGMGDDTFFVDAAGDSVIEAAGEGTDRILAGASYILGTGVSVEMLTTRDAAGTAAIDFVGNEFADTLVGNAGANILNGAGGADVLIALGGNDVLIGGDGVPNTLQGGTGDDTYYVSAAGDSVIEFAGEGNDTVRTALTAYALGGNVENLVFTGTGAFVGVGDTVGNVIVGGGGDDILNGQDGADILVGGAGNDVLIGGTGTNTLQGGAGNDLYYISSADDTIVEAAGGGFDTIATDLAAYMLSGAVETLRFVGQGAFQGTGSGAADVIAGGNGNDELRGLDGDDTLSGNAGADYLFGGAGNDQINGGAGNDRLEGGAGADTFVFADTGIDTITDFAAGADRILIDRAVFTALAAGPLAAGAFVRGSIATDADDRVLYNPDTGTLLYDPDGNGAQSAIQFAVVSVPSGILSASDFLVI